MGVGRAGAFVVCAGVVCAFEVYAFGARAGVVRAFEVYTLWVCAGVVCRAYYQNLYLTPRSKS